MTIFRIYDHDYDDQINFKEFSNSVLFGKSTNEIQIKKDSQKKDRISFQGGYFKIFKTNHYYFIFK